ncbi:class I SAM-dependent methyltransferase [Ciceribacter sp. L1K23]|uniref:class I SAM-dependent methyltransferase n=1 Tax=Ciceribacter sp. L1K23 TaxID=2820276 RepID=UPI001B8285DE|nr:class I SAM-dependent methyltransferase [Ciceribacter sp. L1K23]MBR0556833.1 class I SAM-dependent methyltransferase [Ciceribacter sp. L1K23]
MDEAERIAGLYERHAVAFDRIRGRNLFEKQWLDRFAEGLSTNAAVLDIGCGSGEPIAADLVARGLRVTGIDSSPTLIDLCRSRMPGSEWLVTDMRTMDLGRRFQGLIAWHSFFHLTQDDQRSMFARFATHAAARAMLMFTSGPADGIAIGEFEGEPLYHASLAAEEYRALLKDNGFVVVDHVANDPDCGGATVWLAQRV